MTLLSINNLARIGREKPLFTGVTFGIQEGEKAALIGRNGTGKSTLLNTIAGVLTPDEGEVVFNKECGVSFLPQTPLFNPEDTIREHIFKSDSPKLNLIRKYQEACDELGQKTTEAAQNRYNQAMQLMDQNDLWNYEAQVNSILSTLGLTNPHKKMKELSGGMVKKVALAQVLVEDTKLLLLDEPTNHLDITTITWLQNYLHDTKRSVLMVTHDRYFLDAVCTNIYELARNKLKLYEGNYSQYLEKKQTEAEIEENTERRIESVLRFEREWLLRGPCARGTKIKARIQRDMQLINREKFAKDKGFTFEVQGKRLGGKVLEIHDISKTYAEPIISHFSYKFTAGQKIGIFGDNGSGKSTLLNIITDNIKPDSGHIELGVNTKIGYYNQNPVFENVNLSVLEYIKETADNMLTLEGKTIRAEKFLEEFGFVGKIQYSPVSTLSGGERKKLYLVRLLLQNPNFLILDEPTNDFDIFTMNILEQFLMNYKGCLLLVSHDRYFMDKCADTLFIMEEDGSVSGFVGKTSEYIDYREELKKEAKEKGGEIVKSNLPRVSERNSIVSDSERISSGATETPKSPATPQAPKKLSFNERREFEALDAEIPALEAEQKSLEEKMSSSNFEEAQKAGNRYNEIAKLLEEKYPRWEELAERA